jgi:hypothetical protein
MLFDEGRPRRRPAETAPPAMRVGPSGPFMVRRRSGKVFGPFTESEIAEMLSRGELLGNEDLSADGGETYKAIGTVPAFAAALRHLTDAPVSADAPHAPPGPLETTGARGLPGLAARVRALAAALRGRLGGACAALGGRRLKLLVAAAAVLAVVSIGLAGAATQYGVFFHRLLRGQVGPNRAGAKLLAEARQGLARRLLVVAPLWTRGSRAAPDGSGRAGGRRSRPRGQLLGGGHGGAGGAWPEHRRRRAVGEAGKIPRRRRPSSRARSPRESGGATRR